MTLPFPIFFTLTTYPPTPTPIIPHTHTPYVPSPCSTHVAPAVPPGGHRRWCPRRAPGGSIVAQLIVLRGQTPADKDTREAAADTEKYPAQS